MARPRSPLSKFVLSLPRDLSVKEVLAKAKANGMKTSENNVYRIRRTLGAKATPKSKTPSKPPVKPVANAPASKPTPVSKSDFIRQQPATLSAAEVVAKGKKAGLKFSDSLVYMVRGPKAARKTARKQPARRASIPRKGAASKTAKKPLSKAGFIRSFPTSKAAKDFVAKAKAAGLGIHVNQVYKVRGPAKATTHTKVTKLAARRASTPRNGASVPRPFTTSSAEDLLRALGAEIGLGRAVEILAGERAKLRVVIGG